MRKTASVLLLLGSLALLASSCGSGDDEPIYLGPAPGVAASPLPYDPNVSAECSSYETQILTTMNAFTPPYPNDCTTDTDCKLTEPVATSSSGFCQDACPTAMTTVNADTYSAYLDGNTALTSQCEQKLQAGCPASRAQCSNGSAQCRGGHCALVN